LLLLILLAQTLPIVASYVSNKINSIVFFVFLFTELIANARC